MEKREITAGELHLNALSDLIDESSQIEYINETLAKKSTELLASSQFNLFDFFTKAMSRVRTSEAQKALINIWPQSDLEKAFMEPNLDVDIDKDAPINSNHMIVLLCLAPEIRVFFLEKSGVKPNIDAASHLHFPLDFLIQLENYLTNIKTALEGHPLLMPFFETYKQKVNQNLYNIYSTEGSSSSEPKEIENQTNYIMGGIGVSEAGETFLTEIKTQGKPQSNLLIILKKWIQAIVNIFNTLNCHRSRRKKQKSKRSFFQNSTFCHLKTCVKGIQKPTISF
jgi:hypothetical protein